MDTGGSYFGPCSNPTHLPKYSNFVLSNWWNELFIHYIGITLESTYLIKRKNKLKFYNMASKIKVKIKSTYVLSENFELKVRLDDLYFPMCLRFCSILLKYKHYCKILLAIIKVQYTNISFHVAKSENWKSNWISFFQCGLLHR